MPRSTVPGLLILSSIGGITRLHPGSIRDETRRSAGKPPFSTSTSGLSGDGLLMFGDITDDDRHPTPHIRVPILHNSHREMREAYVYIPFSLLRTVTPAFSHPPLTYCFQTSYAPSLRTVDTPAKSALLTQLQPSYPSSTATPTASASTSPVRPTSASPPPRPSSP